MDDLEDEMSAVFNAAAPGVAADLLAEATNLLGDRLRPEMRDRILALLRSPSPDTWDDAHSIILNGSKRMGLTLWQAMIGTDPNCPTSGRSSSPSNPLVPAEKWDGYTPEPFMVLAALQAAVEP